MWVIEKKEAFMDEVLKFGLSPKNLVYFNESSLRKRNNASYSVLKAIFVLEIFKFCLMVV